MGETDTISRQAAILRLWTKLSDDRLAKLLEGLKLQRDNGVMLLGPGLEFCGVMPRDAETEVVRKAADDD